MSFFSKTRIKASELFQDSFRYLQATYDQAIEVFTPASPFGQILTVVANLGELIFFYIESALTELNIARARNIESIYGLSRLTGHNPTRGISARGIVGFRLNEKASQINGSYVQINNYAEVEAEETGLTYFLEFDSDFIRLEKSNRSFVNVNLIQGKLETQTFTGSGQDLQSFNMTTKELTDNDYVIVKVDGTVYENVDSLYDMDHDAKAVMVKAGINGGLSIFFGNKQFGYPPPLGSIIEVTYLKTSGASGNISGDKTLTIKFKEGGTTPSGEDVDLNEYVSINIVRTPNLGSNSEDPDFTRLIAPYSSRSFVLANPNNYIYYLRKYDFFSFIDAYNTKDDEYINDNNIIYLFLIPDIKKKLTSDKDYFNVDESEFILTPDEKTQVLDILNASGRQVVTAEVRINDPIIKRYSLNVVLRYFEEADQDKIRNDIREELNLYFLNVNRRDRIPRSDIIGIIENVEGIDSVNVFFISEENEKAIKNGFYEIPVYGIDPNTDQKVLIETKRINLTEGEDPQLGLDEFGDIIIEKEDLAIIRGGWVDRNDNFYEEVPLKNGISSLNIFFKESIENNLYNKTQQEKYNNLKRNKGTTIATGRNAKSTNSGRLQTTSAIKAIGNTNGNN
jgi:hypothetical protein